MSAIAQLLPPGNILLDLDVPNKERVFEAVGQLLNGRYGLVQTQVVDSLNARERLGCTGLGHGVAIPHARIKGLNQAVAVFVRTKSPIPFDAPDGRPVFAMVALFVPQQANEQHLKILAEVAEMFGDKHFREQLRTCVDPAAVSKLFADWPSTDGTSARLI
jgi:PTS system nitrogen regulatory IIA component